MVKQLVDEHPDACKPSARVMADQADLVEVVHELHQVVNLKGTWKNARDRPAQGGRPIPRFPLP